MSVFAGGLLMGWVANTFATDLYPASYLTPLEQIVYGGFAFAAVFMATDPVTAARTTTGKYIYGFMIGVIAVIIRTYNNGYPEGAHAGGVADERVCPADRLLCGTVQYFTPHAPAES